MHYAHVLVATQLTLPHVSSQGWIASSEVWGEGWRELDPLRSVPRVVGAAAEWAGRESHLGGVSERRAEENVGGSGEHESNLCNLCHEMVHSLSLL